MTVVFGIAIFFVVWWITLFAVLPFGVRTQGEAGDTVPGTPASAPENFPIVRIALLNTAVSIVVFLIIWALIEFDVFDIAQLANKASN